MSSRLVPKSVISNDLDGVMAVTVRYFSKFGKLVFVVRTVRDDPLNNRVDLWRHLCMSLLHFVVRVLCRRKESSR